MRTKTLAMVVAVFLTASANAEDAAKKDLENLQGLWEMTEGVHDGRDVSADVKIKLKIKGDEVAVEGNEEVTKDYAKFKIKIDPSTSPKAMDLIVTGGEQKDTTLEGIYELKGDKLKIAVKLGGKERPTKFGSPEGSSIAYMVLQRVKT